MDCRCAEKLREVNYRTSSYPFDWISTKFESICTILLKILDMNDEEVTLFCQDLFDIKNGIMHRLEYNQQSYFVHDDFEILFIHDHEDLKDVCTKYTRRFIRMRNDFHNADKVTLVFTSKWDYYDDQLLALLEKLMDYRTVELFCINGFKNPVDHPNITNIDFDYKPEYNDADWTFDKTVYSNFVRDTFRERLSIDGINLENR